MTTTDDEDTSTIISSTSYPYLDIVHTNNPLLIAFQNLHLRSIENKTDVEHLRDVQNDFADKPILEQFDPHLKLYRIFECCAIYFRHLREHPSDREKRMTNKKFYQIYHAFMICYETIVKEVMIFKPLEGPEAALSLTNPTDTKQGSTFDNNLQRSPHLDQVPHSARRHAEQYAGILRDSSLSPGNTNLWKSFCQEMKQKMKLGKGSKKSQSVLKELADQARKNKEHDDQDGDEGSTPLVPSKNPDMMSYSEVTSMLEDYQVRCGQSPLVIQSIDRYGPGVYAFVHLMRNMYLAPRQCIPYALSEFLHTFVDEMLDPRSMPVNTDNRTETSSATPKTNKRKAMSTPSVAKHEKRNTVSTSSTAKQEKRNTAKKSKTTPRGTPAKAKTETQSKRASSRLNPNQPIIISDEEPEPQDQAKVDAKKSKAEVGESKAEFEKSPQRSTPSPRTKPDPIPASQDKVLSKDQDASSTPNINEIAKTLTISEIDNASKDILEGLNAKVTPEVKKTPTTTRVPLPLESDDPPTKMQWFKDRVAANDLDSLDFAYWGHRKDLIVIRDLYQYDWQHIVLPMLSDTVEKCKKSIQEAKEFLKDAPEIPSLNFDNKNPQP